MPKMNTDHKVRPVRFALVEIGPGGERVIVTTWDRVYEIDRPLSAGVIGLICLVHELDSDEQGEINHE